MSPRPVVHGIEVLDQFIAKSREFMNDWLRFNQIMSAFPSPGVNRAQLESHFLQIKSKLARDHHVLRTRLGADCQFSPDIVNILSGATTLETLYSQSDVAIRKFQSEWHRAFITVNETLGNLDEKHKRAMAGERVAVGGMLIQVKVKKEFPWRKVALYAGAFAACCVIILGLYFMRNFLGYWAPGAGEGLAVTEEMSDEEQMNVLLDTMKSAIANQDIDTMMTAFSDNYSDEGARGKAEVRTYLQAYKVAGGLQGATIDYSSAKLEISGDIAIYGPAFFVGPQDQATFTVAGKKENGRWLITALGGI